MSESRPSVAIICGGRQHEAGALVLVGHEGVRTVLHQGCRQPTWAPTGQYLAFEIAGSVAVLSLSDGIQTTLAPIAHNRRGRGAFQFDRSGSCLAVATPTGLLIQSVSTTGGDMRLLSLPRDLDVDLLLWSETGRTLAASGYDSNGEARVVWLDPESGTRGTTLHAEAISVPNDSFIWLRRSSGGLPDIEALRLSRNGETSMSYTCPEGRFVFGWLPGFGKLILGAFCEDEGDETEISLADPSGSYRHIVLSGVRGVRGVGFSPDGEYLGFVQQDDPAAVYVKSTSHDSSQRLDIALAELLDGDAQITELAMAPMCTAVGPWV